MNEYIIYTFEGHTSAPKDNIEVENCQVLGRAIGANQKEAQKNLEKDNPWIANAGFDTSKFIVKQILTEEQRADVLALLDCLTIDEQQCDANIKSCVWDIVNRLKDI